VADGAQPDDLGFFSPTVTPQYYSMAAMGNQAVGVAPRRAMWHLPRSCRKKHLTRIAEHARIDVLVSPDSHQRRMLLSV